MVRYALVGLIGLPINNVALALFLHLLGGVYWSAQLCAFEVSSTINFWLNQRITYRDQRGLRGWDWPRRALKAQAASASALVISLGAGFALHYGLRWNAFAATDTGIALAFFYNFFVSRRIVFRPIEGHFTGGRA